MFPFGANGKAGSLSVPLKKNYLFMAVLGLGCCAGFSLVAVQGLEGT